MQDIILSNLKQSQEALQNLLANKKTLLAIEEAAKTFSKALQAGQRIYSCGNGGSMCDAMHFAEELTGRFRDNRRSLAALAISDPGYLSCAANDFGYAHVFSRFIEGFGQTGDCLLAISTSGKSENVMLAAKKAKELGMHVICLTGNEGSLLSQLADIEISTPGTSSYADRVQELHIKCIHILIDLIEKELA